MLEYPTLTVNKSDEFFITVAKQGNHSFVMLGVIQNNEPELLARVGKIMVSSGFSVLDNLMLAGSIFSDAESLLEDEGIAREDDKERRVSYMSYALNYEQAMQFISLVSQIGSEQFIGGVPKCYQPNNDGGSSADEIVTLKYTGNRCSLDLKNKPIVDRTQKISLRNNTCRHTALDILKYTLGIDHHPKHISTLFFQNLPLKTTLVKGKPNKATPFYVIPPPPTVFLKGKSFKKLGSKERALIRIYKKMEKLLTNAPHSQDTKNKFDALKSLYNQLAGKNEQSLDAYIQQIMDWRKENPEAINTFRASTTAQKIGRFFCKETATKKLIDSVQIDLECQFRSKN